MNRKNGVFTIGTDTELFLQRKSDGKFISAIPYIKGSKHNPTILKSKTGNIQHDNVSVEFATNPATSKPTKTKKSFVDIIKTTLNDVVDYIPKDHDVAIIASTKKTGMGLGLTIVSAIIADHNGMIRVRDNHPNGTKFVVELPVET